MTYKHLLLILLLGFLVACGSEANSSTATVAPPQEPAAATVSIQPEQEIQVLLASSELIVGSNRFALALLDAEGQMIEEARVELRYFDLSDPTSPVLEQEAEAERIQSSDGLTTLFTHERLFDRAGEWGVEVQASVPDATVATQRIAFQVLADSDSVLPGEPAPLVDTPTAASVNGDLTLITSATEPEPAFYEQSLADVLNNGRPTLLYFATPAFCQSRLCGPGYDVFDELAARHGDALNFIHVEVFTGLPDPAASGWKLAPAMNAFGLTTEPWLYLIDNDGTVVYRVEGLFTVDEIEQQLQPLIDQAEQPTENVNALQAFWASH
jgi:hypothetical protein